MPVTLGIDVGTGSVRVCLKDDEVIYTAERDISIYKDQLHSNYVTQSSEEIFDKILEMIKESKVVPDAIAVTATCSMVVRKKTQACDSLFLESISMDNETDSKAHDIISWMDNRALEEAEQLNQTVEETILKQLGGRIIPEMGLPKLKWISDHIEEDVVCFELYDWFTYLFLSGGFLENGRVRYMKLANNKHQHYLKRMYAMDGSIKGWSKNFLRQIGIKNSVSIGQSEFNFKQEEGLLAVGVPLGYVHEDIIGKGLKVIVANGCIDSYSGWISTLDEHAIHENDLSMVAGTSTCFIFTSHSANNEPIKGIWGPFDQLVSIPAVLYEFGQPATGKLFDNLFNNYKTVLESLDANNIFDLMEAETAKLEHKFGKDIHSLIKNYFWYIDQYGNRSPHNDFSMSEVIIDGYNSTPYLSSITNGLSLTGLVIRYNLVLEFLSFQTRQILEIAMAGASSNVSCIRMVGSQSQNRRFVELLSVVTMLPVKVFANSQSTKYMVSEGSATISKLGLALRDTSASYFLCLLSSIPTENNYSTVKPNEPICSKYNTSLLNKKYEVFLDIALSQQRYRRIIA